MVALLSLIVVLRFFGVGLFLVLVERVHRLLQYFGVLDEIIFDDALDVVTLVAGEFCVDGVSAAGTCTAGGRGCGGLRRRQCGSSSVAATNVTKRTG